MEVRGEDYRVTYNPTIATITCEGSLQFYGAAGYAPIAELLTQAADQKPAKLTLDLKKLEFLNSSGINTISKFVIRVRNHNVSELIVQSSTKIPWQERSLENLQRLMPGMKLVFE